MASDMDPPFPSSIVTRKALPLGAAGRGIRVQTSLPDG